VVEFTDPVLRDSYRAFKNRLLQIPSIDYVSASFNSPADLINQATMRPVDQPVDKNWIVNLFGTDYDFIKSLGIELLAGRDFLRENPADTLTGVLVNETAVREFGWESPEAAIGERVTFSGGNPDAPELVVIGVVSDFYMQSVHERITPMVIMYWNFQSYFYSFIKINSNIKSTLSKTEAAWREVMLNYPFHYSFLDDKFDKLYKSEKTLGKLLSYFAILTVIIACMGLYGLASFMVEQRTKEIGIRKVLGASVSKITFSLANEYSLLILIAFVIASPVAYWFMDVWLQTFEYHISIPYYVFGVSLVFALIISFLTVSVQSVKAATDNPVNSLRTE
jgi:putative ABC transport system permease protein